MGPGFLLVLEGVDGSGKSTLARALSREIEKLGHEVVMTREPTNGPFGKRIRELAASGRDAITGEEEFQLFHADRQAHVAEVVRPALARGAVVIQDRSHFSSIAYQGERGVDRARIAALSEAIAPAPDLLLIIDVPAEVAVDRIRSSRGAALDDFEHKEALDRVRRVFLGFGEGVVVDGAKSPDDVFAEAWALVRPRLNLLHGRP